MVRLDILDFLRLFRQRIRMARRMRCADAGYVYHVLNRAVGRATLFDKPADYAAFEKVIR
jgi:hypothetical protein